MPLFLPYRPALTFVILGLSIPFSAPQAFAEEVEFYRDIRPNHWMWNGADPLTVDNILARVAATGDGSSPPDLPGEAGASVWLEEFSRAGDQLRSLAEAQEALGLTGAAAELYMRASANYTLAKYPLIDPTDAETAAYAASLDTLHRAYELRGYTVEPIEVPFEGGVADGHILYPAGTAPEAGWPLLIASNGLDVNQGEFFSFAEMVADRGIAFLMYDIAGTGTNAEFPLTPSFEAIPAAFAEAVPTTAPIDGDRIAIMGVSFGGNAAVKLAHTRPDLFAAAVNVCGPLHAAFAGVTVESFGEVGLMYRVGLFDRTGFPQTDVPGMVAYLRGFSLIEQGVVGPGIAPTDVPILSVNARDDYVAPTFDMDLANSSTTDGTLIYSGENDHCPQDRYTVMPQIADWVQDRLSRVQG